MQPRRDLSWMKEVQWTDPQNQRTYSCAYIPRKRAEGTKYGSKYLIHGVLGWSVANSLPAVIDKLERGLVRAHTAHAQRTLCEPRRSPGAPFETIPDSHILTADASLVCVCACFCVSVCVCVYVCVCRGVMC